LIEFNLFFILFICNYELLTDFPLLLHYPLLILT
jgi:hypothetical protein